MYDPGLEKLTITLTVEQARVLCSAAKYMARKKRKEAQKKPFIPLPGHYNLNLRHGELLSKAAVSIQEELDGRKARK